jgi:hypothetical protein
MSFWESELGEITGTAADAFTKTFTQIPDGTMALARIESFITQEYKNTGFKFLEILWSLTDGDFKGANVKQKLKVFGGDSKDKDPLRTKHRSLNMLRLIYQLFNIKPKHANEPTEEDLSVFIGKVAGIKIRETEPDPAQDGKQYNWVSEVHDSKGFKCETGISVVVTHTNKQQHNSDLHDNAFSRNQNKVTADDLDDIPF